MTTDVERLLVRLEVTQRRFERELQRASRTADRRSRQIERRFRQLNRNVSRGFASIDRAAGQAFGRMARLAGTAATALGTRQLVRYADAWARIENQIRAAEQISGTAARTTDRLNDLAIESRAGLEETASLYARLLRISGDLGASEEQVARATTIVARAFRAGGAAASEQAAGVLQLSQALSSGFLQGDELRSLRENAPLIARAIAEEFDTTIGGLKELGAQGELTSDRVFAAILNGQAGINAAFNATTATVADSFTILQNGMTEFSASFAEASGLTDRLSGGLTNLGNWFSENGPAAARFGAQVREAFTVLGEAFEVLDQAFIDMGFNLSGAGTDVADFLTNTADLFQAFVATVGAIPATIAAAVLNSVDAVRSGAITMLNSAIGTVEALVNTIIQGLNSAANAVNTFVNRYSPVPVQAVAPIAPVSLPRGDAPVPLEARDTAQVFRETRDGIREGLEGFEDSVVGVIRRIQRAGDTPSDPFDPRGNQITDGRRPGLIGRSSNNPADNASSVSAPAAAGGGGGGGRETMDAFFAATEEQRSQLERDIALAGQSAGAMATLTARENLLAEARRRNLDLNARQTDTGETLLQQIDRQAAAIGRLTDQYGQAQERAQFFDEQTRTLKDGILDAIIEGENLAGTLENVAKAFARAALEAALFNSGPFASGGGGGLGGGLGNLLGGFFGGFRAKGGPVLPGRSYVVGEEGPELFEPNTSGTIVPNGATMSAGRTAVEIALADGLEAQILEKARMDAVTITRAGVSEAARQQAIRESRPQW